MGGAPELARAPARGPKDMDKASPSAREMEGQLDPGVTAAQSTLRPLYLMCTFLFIAWLKPSEPFLVDFYVDVKGLTNKEVYDRIFPLWQYMHLPALLLVAVASEAVGCKVVVVAGALCGVATVALTLFPSQLALLQMAEVTVAVSFASHSAASALVYGSLPTGRYQMAAHWSKAASLAGSCVAAVGGQLMRSHFSLPVLFATSLVGQAVAFVVACWLPSSRKTPPAHSLRDPVSLEETPSPSVGKEAPRSEGLLHDVAALLHGVVSTMGGACQDLALALRVDDVLPWTLWAVVAGAVHRAVLTYWQSLIRAHSAPASSDLNGSFLAVSYLTAAGIAAATYRAPLRRFKHTVLLLSPLLSGLLLLAVARPGPLLSTYALLLGYTCLHEVSSIVCSTAVATAIGIADATATSRAIHGLSSTASRIAFLRSTADQRLAVLFAMTAAASVATEAGMQLIFQHGLHQKLPGRFSMMGVLLLAFASVTNIAGLYVKGRESISKLSRAVFKPREGNQGVQDTALQGRTHMGRGQPPSPIGVREPMQESVPLLEAQS